MNTNSIAEDCQARPGLQPNINMLVPAFPAGFAAAVFLPAI